ncbi:hypothetical protein AVEN_240497-1 [Araneus ventricosus]|uniref:Uncharacterized protein n=1 Tax=Araneus ventricosus TaxID=182803 RepID=A0A4Y2P7R1_ARAVE|nr:hypothetical protein AVEN_240497-1 [Araneus ventricosus]
MAITKRREIIPTEQYSSVSEEFIKERQAEDDSDALYRNGEVTEYSDQESNSETEMEDNPVHEELQQLKPEHIRLYHPSIQPLILSYHKIKLCIIKQA